MSLKDEGEIGTFLVQRNRLSVRVKITENRIQSNGFRQWFTALKITWILDFVHRPEF
jgi:ribosomal protein L21